MWQLVSEASVTITFICLLREYLIVKAKVEPDVSFLRTAVLLLLDDLTLFVTKAKLDRSSVNLDNRHSNHPAVEHNPGGPGLTKATGNQRVILHATRPCTSLGRLLSTPPSSTPMLLSIQPTPRGCKCKVSCDLCPLP